MVGDRFQSVLNHKASIKLEKSSLPQGWKAETPELVTMETIYLLCRVLVCFIGKSPDICYYVQIIDEHIFAFILILNKHYFYQI